MIRFKTLVFNGAIVLSISLTGFLLSFANISGDDKLSDINGILFSSNREGSGRSVFLMDQNGENISQITKNAIRGDNMVTLSPDKATLLFATYRFSGWKLATSDISGKDINRLTTSKGYETSAAWSNDGQYIVYSKIDGPGRGFTKLFLAKSNGQLIKQLNKPPMHNVKPIFSPDDSKVLFEQYDYRSQGSSVADIMELDITTGELKNLTKGRKELAFAPAYSPDGKTIAYLSVDSKKKVSFALMDPNGDNRKILVENIGVYPGGEDQFFMRISWDEDGNRVVFSVFDGNDYELFIIDVKSRNIRQVTNNRFDDVQPYWIK